MTSAVQFAGQIFRAIGGAILTLALWTLWLALAGVFIFQLYIVSHNELPVPTFLLQQLEERLARSGLRVTFSRTSFDPTGRILIEDAGVSLPAFSEPVLNARGIYIGLNPWFLAVGRFEPDEIRIIGATGVVPAMLSPSGAPEELIRDLDVTLFPSGRRLDVTQLSARLAGVAVSARGSVPIPRTRIDAPPLAVAAIFQKHFPRVVREALAWAERLEAFREPSLVLNLVPSESGALQVNTTFRAREVTLDTPIIAQAENLEIKTNILMLDGRPAISRIDAAARALRLPFDVSARAVEVSAFGRLRPGELFFELREIAVSAESAEAAGIAAHALSAQIFPRPLPRVEANLVARIVDSPLAFRADADLAARSGTVRFQGSIAPAVLELVGRFTGRDIRRHFDFASLECADAELRLGPGWKFEQLDAQVALERIHAHGVVLDEGHATVTLEPHRFHSPRAFARIGENFAHGSYDHDLQTKAFRFLLDGQLRPLHIAPWFREWWANFFHQFEFPPAPPLASVDVRGVWGEGVRTSVFVRADAAGPIIRGAAFDHVHTRLFIRPGFFDGLDVDATQGTQTAAGTFTYTTNTESHAWRTLELDLQSSFNTATAAQVIGPIAAEFLAPFQLAGAPEVRLRGRLDGPGSPRGRHHDLRVDARTAGEFRFHYFPLQDVSFTATLRGNEVLLENIEAGFAGGVTRGRVRVVTAGGRRQLAFEATLKDAALGRLAAGVEEFFAHKHKRTPSPPGKFVQEKASVRVDLSATAGGNYAEPYSFNGDGTAVLRGAEIGEVPLLGALSELFTFTALRFTSAQARFKVDGPKLVFSEFALRGASSAIDAYGDYAIDRHELDFKAKVFPFQESGNLIKSVVGAVLTPISNVLEVKLTGSLEKPQWSFVLGPTNFLRSLAPPLETSQEKADATRPPPPAGTATSLDGTPRPNF